MKLKPELAELIKRKNNESETQKDYKNIPGQRQVGTNSK